MAYYNWLNKYITKFLIFKQIKNLVTTADSLIISNLEWMEISFQGAKNRG